MVCRAFELRLRRRRGGGEICTGTQAFAHMGKTLTVFGSILRRRLANRGEGTLRAQLSQRGILTIEPMLSIRAC